jgi:hypothetical protein
MATAMAGMLVSGLASAHAPKAVTSSAWDGKYTRSSATSSGAAGCPGDRHQELVVAGGKFELLLTYSTRRWSHRDPQMPMQTRTAT